MPSPDDTDWLVGFALITVVGLGLYAIRKKVKARDSTLPEVILPPARSGGSGLGAAILLLVLIFP